MRIPLIAVTSIFLYLLSLDVFDQYYYNLQNQEYGHQHAAAGGWSSEAYDAMQKEYPTLSYIHNNFALKRSTGIILILRGRCTRDLRSDGLERRYMSSCNGLQNWISDRIYGEYEEK